MLDLPTAIRRVSAGEDLSRDAMQSVVGHLMRGEATDAQIGALLTALHIKGESVEEIAGAALIMRQMAAKVTPKATPICDSVGTGGDVAKLFNVSTASALVTAAAGANVAKHGNRAATGNSGSADVLEAAGVNISITPEQVAACIDQCGIGFLFAPTHHAATRHVIAARKQIGVRSIFNLLGPLTNPAGAQHQLVGVFAKRWVRPVAEVFAQLGSVHTLVVCSDDDLDEISIAADTQVAEYRNGTIREYRISPEQFGFKKQSLAPLRVADPQASLALIRDALGGKLGAAADMVALNAGASIYAADLCDCLEAGITRAREILQNGDALAKLEQLAAFTAELGG